MKRTPSRSVVLALVAVIVLSAGCATLKTGADPILVRAQQTYATATHTADLLFNLEFDNRALVEAKLPGTRAKVDVLRKNAKTYLPVLLKTIDQYKAASTKENANALSIALAVVEGLLGDLQMQLVKTSEVKVGG